MRKIPQDIVGDIAILKFPQRTLWIIKKLKAWKFLKDYPSIKTVLEKTSGFSGTLRTLKTKYLAGIRTKEAVYRENDCVFRFNVEEVYFSPRLSNERKIVAEEIVRTSRKNGTKILVMFAGAGPYPIVIAKRLKSARKKAEIISNELNKKANAFAKRNIAENKLGEYISVVEGDAKNLPNKLKSKFDIILMPRPNLVETFLKTALKLSKKGTIIFYHGFGSREEVLSEIQKDVGKKIEKIKIRKAGDIGFEKFRWQARFRVK